MKEVIEKGKDPFKEYSREKDPTKRDLASYWRTAIGLQQVDGLTPSPYLVETAKGNIEGKVSLREVYDRLEGYYAERREEALSRTKEADVVSARITEVLSEDGFSFTVAELLSIHRRLFEGLLPRAGEVREYNITKKEWVLDGESVTYGTAPEILATLEYDIGMERTFHYQGLSMEGVIRRLSAFVAGVWQIHPFAEGNTRTIAVFFIKYLRTLGFDVTNDVFASNAWYFRNALVRANYTDLRLGVHSTTAYLELFLHNALLGESNVLKNRDLRISDKAAPDAVKVTPVASKKDARTMRNIEALYGRFGLDKVFGRAEVIEALSISPSAASALLKKLTACGILLAVKGQGKGRYLFSAEASKR